MKEYLFVSFNLGRKGLRKTRALLERSSLTKEADFSDRGSVAEGLCHVRLRAEDPRLELLLKEVRSLGEEPSVRTDREYSKRELDRFPWLRLMVGTAGLLGGANLNQPFDFSNACERCGSGAVPVPPLVADLPRMGKKLLEVTAHDRLLIAHQTLVSAIEDSGLTGISPRAARRRSSRQPDSRFHWLQVNAEWPPMAPSRVLRTERPCPTCQRSGHFDCYRRATEFHYAAAPKNAPDFASTWEYFGVWGLGEGPSVGGGREIIVSQRARQLLIRAGVKRVSYQPIVFVETAA